MGYWTDKNYPSITNFTPDDTPSRKYILCEYGGSSFSELAQIAQEHFGLNADELDRIEIAAEKIHTRCIYYDSYDPGDYDDYIVLILKDEF